MPKQVIPTAEEFLKNFNEKKGNIDKLYYDSYVKKSMIEFAKLHVKEALKEALESIPCLGSSTDIATYEEVEEAVLNAYPLENIK